MSSHANKDAELHSHGDTHGHGSRRGYYIGFAASVVLTAIPFWLVMSGVLHSIQATALTIMAFAFVQILVHTVLFLHVNTRGQGGWTLITLVFTAVIAAIILGGSLWVMYHLNTNMMPMSADMSQMP